MTRRLVVAVASAACALLASACTSSSTPQSTGTPASSVPATPTATSPSAPSNAEPGAWRLLPPAPVKKPMFGVAAAWDGTDVFVSGRVCPEGTPGFTQTVAYRPSTNTWRTLPRFTGPRGCFEGGDNAIWDGKELLLIGITNAAYSPDTNTWRKLPPGGRGNFAQVAAWTGHQTLGFGGGCCGEAYDMVRSFTPSTNSWSDPPRSPLGGRNGVFGAWDGKELIVAGGAREETNGFHTFATGAAYDAAAKTWRTIATLPAPRQDAAAVWDGSQVLVVGGSRIGTSATHYYSRGLSFDPSTNQWNALPPMAYPRTAAAAVWTGSQLLVWGGATVASHGTVPPPHGEAFDPSTNRWSPLAKSPLRGRDDPAAVWTGSQMFIWGGQATDGDTFFYDGALYTPGG